MFLVGIFIICQPIISVDVRKYLSSWQWPSRKDVSEYALVVAGGVLIGSIATAIWAKRRSKKLSIPLPLTLIAPSGLVQATDIPSVPKILLSGIMVPPRILTIDKNIVFIGKQTSTIFPHQQGLVICLDNDERGKGAQTLHTLAALYHKVPLLVSTSVLKNIFVGIDTQDVTVEKALQDKTGESIFLFYVATIRALFNDNEWLILKLSENFVLLLPMHVVQKLGGSPEAQEGYFTQQELNLGLKISNFKKLNRNELQAFLKKYTLPQQFDYFLKDVPNLFITQEEYKNNNELSHEPQWTFFLNGHGLVKGNIAGLSEKHFIEFLNYLNTQLLTRFLVVNSCFAMSVIKQNQQSSTMLIYSFPIAVIGSVDCVAFVPHPILHVEGPAQTPRWEFAENLDQSFEYVWQKKYDSSPYDASLILASQAILLQTDLYGADPHKLAESLAAYVPHVLAAGSTTFAPLLPSVEINQEMAKSRGADRPLDILATIDEQQKQQHYTNKLKYVLLLLNTAPGNQLNIKFPIILRKHSQEQPAPYIMVSSLGKNYFYIAKMESDWSLSDIIYSIGHLAYAARKIYWIANFTDKSGSASWIYTVGDPHVSAVQYKDMIIDFDNPGGGIKVYCPYQEGIYACLFFGKGSVRQDSKMDKKEVVDIYRPMFEFALSPQ